MDEETDVIDDIGADIRSAITQLNTETPAAEPALSSPEPVEAKAEEPSGQLRDDKGRFAAKEQEPVAAVASPAPQPSGQGAEDQKSLAPPAKWEPEAKAAFLAAPPAIQKQILAQAEGLDKGRAEWQPKEQTYNELDRVIAPVRDKWAMNGMGVAQGVAALIAAQNLLDQDPIAGLAQIARSYGVTPQHLLARMGLQQEGGEQPAPQPQADPRVDQIIAYMNQEKQAERQRALAAVQDEIQKFAADPKNVYFENVRDHMGMLMKSAADRGEPIDLQQAYEMATWAQPNIRKLILQKQASEASEERARQAAAQNAKRKDVQVVGDPGGGGAASRKGPTLPNPTDDIRGDVIRSLQEVRSSV